MPQIARERASRKTSDVTVAEPAGGSPSPLGDCLRLYRNSKHYTQSDLASILGIQQQELSNLETGASPITANHLERLRRDGLDVEKFFQGAAADRDRVLDALHLFENLYKGGLLESHPTRSSALQSFRADIEREIAGIDLFGSSLKGLLMDRETIDAIGKALARGAKMRVLITHPALAFLRAYVEGRRENAIEGEIDEAISNYCRKLIQLAPGQVEVRVALHPPTIFLLVLKSQLKALINPYTMTTEAYTTHSLIVRQTSEANCLYRQYSEHHFENAWSREDRLLLGEPVSIPLELYESLRGKDLAKALVEAGNSLGHALRQYAQGSRPANHVIDHQPEHQQ